MDNILKFVGIGALGWLLLTRVFNNVWEKIQFGTIELKLGKFALDRWDVTLQLPITNNSSLPVPIDGFIGDLMYGNTPIAHMDVQRSFVINANDTITVPIQAFINPLNLVGDIVTLIEAKEFLQELYIVGIVRSAGIDFEVRKNIQVL